MYCSLAISLALFGAVRNSSSDVLFISLSLFARLSEGLASSFVIATLITMASAYYLQNASYINAMVFGAFLSEFIGPLWGGLLFEVVGYTGLFLLQSATILVFSLALCYYFRDLDRAHPL